LDEAAGAADASACSRDGYFLIYKICVLSDNRLRCAVPTFLDDLASGTPEAIKRRNDHSIPININRDFSNDRRPGSPCPRPAVVSWRKRLWVLKKSSVEFLTKQPYSFGSTATLLQFERC